MSDYVRFDLLDGDERVVTSGMRYGVLWTITKEMFSKKTATYIFKVGNYGLTLSWRQQIARNGGTQLPDSTESLF